MGLVDDLKLVATKKGPDCTVARLLSNLSPDEAQAVLQIIDDEQGSLSGLSKVLSGYGYQVNAKTLRRHRYRGDASKDGCKCP